MRAVMIFVLWTWMLTPLWVNIVGTCILGTSIILKSIINIIKG